MMGCRYYDWPARSENVILYFQGLASQATSTLGKLCPYCFLLSVARGLIIFAHHALWLHHAPLEDRAFGMCSAKMRRMS